MEKALNLCRLCLSDSPIYSFYKTKIEDFPLIKIIQKVCYEISIKESDSLPQSCCTECFNALNIAHKLNKVSVDSEKELKRLSSSSSVEDDFLDDEITCNESEEGVVEEKIDPDNDDKDPDFSFNKAGKRMRKVLKRFECSTCQKTFEKPSKLLRHEKIHDVNKKPYACEIFDCFHRFTNPESLQRHQIIHSGMISKVASEPCVICSKEFDTQEAMASHMRIHKDDMMKIDFSCNLCDKVFTKLNDLTRHSRTHVVNKNFKCNICSKMFSQGSHLIDHLNRHNGLRPHICLVCNKSFQQSSTLKDHLRTHSTEKPFLCSQCGKSFNNPSNLRQHVKRHLNLKEYECTLCPGKFSSHASLQSHIRSHSGIKSISCEICASQFTKGSSLKKHIRSIHEGIKDHPCSSCTMKFSSAEHLKRHFRTHSGTFYLTSSLC